MSTGAAVDRERDAGAVGLSSAQAASRLEQDGPNVLPLRTTSLLRTIGAQFRNVVLVLLLVTAAVSGAVGEVQDASVIVVILLISVTLGAVNEYRSARASEALGNRLAHTAAVQRDGTWRSIDVRELVVGDSVALSVGSIVPADARLVVGSGLQCDESVLTGESRPVDKRPTDGSEGMLAQGTVVVSGSGTAIVTATGARTSFGHIAAGLRTREPETAFQAGIAQFSRLLVAVAAVLMVMIVTTALFFHRPILTTVLFALAIAVGVTPQLLPAVVSTALGDGARRLRRQHVLVKRLVCVEDLGGVDVLVTDKTGTLTSGALKFESSLDPDGTPDPRVLAAAALTVEEAAVGVAGSVADLLDRELLEAARADPVISVEVGSSNVVARTPFDHERRWSSAVVEQAGLQHVVVKGAPDAVLARCSAPPPAASQTLARLLATGRRVLAVGASEPQLPPAQTGAPLRFVGFVVFEDPPRYGVAASVHALHDLSVRIVVATGDDPIVAANLAASIGIVVDTALTGTALDLLPDDQWSESILRAGVIARVTPEEKAAAVSRLRRAGHTVAFLGDGVNDALALHAADVGISVVTATDVARDAADVVLFDKDLGAVAAGIQIGRRVFGNTLKYVMMGTSSNIGNMMSAAIAASFLPFLPMLPAQILLNNLLYDLGQLTIPSDRVDPEMTAKPTRWDIGAVRRFMLTFGPVSSLFDFITFAVLIGVVHAAPAEFRTAWFVESLMTQSLIIFVIRTRRVPSFRSHPGWWLMITVLTTTAVGIAVPMTGFRNLLGFSELPTPLLATIAIITVTYLALAEAMKALLFRYIFHGEGRQRRDHARAHRVLRAAARYPRQARH